jgi:hypothetical protein
MIAYGHDFRHNTSLKIKKTKHVFNNLIIIIRIIYESTDRNQFHPFILYMEINLYIVGILKMFFFI